MCQQDANGFKVVVNENSVHTFVTSIKVYTWFIMQQLQNSLLKHIHIFLDAITVCVGVVSILHIWTKLQEEYTVTI